MADIIIDNEVWETGVILPAVPKHKYHQSDLLAYIDLQDNCFESNIDDSEGEWSLMSAQAGPSKSNSLR